MTESQAVEPRGRSRHKVTRIEKLESPEMPTYYANSVDILTSAYDFIMTIGQMLPSGEDKVLVQQQARIIMSPQHLKAFAGLLAQKVREYEAEVGLIPDVPGDSKPDE